jgi:VanZ family protein
VRTNQTKTALGVASVFVTLGILFCTLWPFNPFPRNKVSWLTDANGVRITADGLLLSTAPPVSEPGQPVTVEVYLKPYEIDGVYTILDFFQRHIPYQFRIRQYHEGLIVSRQWRDADGTLKYRKIDLDDGLSPGVLSLVTISSGKQGTAIYLDGKWRQSYPNFRFTTSDLTGELAIGSAASGPEPWNGEVHGVAIYSKAFSSADAENSFDTWNSGNFSPDPPDCIARYRFAERTGGTIANDVANGTALRIPKYFQVPQQAFLTLPWNEFDWSRSYFADVVRNVLGFVPFGLALCGYLSCTRFKPQARWMTILAGAMLSLGIEIMQAFLPQRVSGLTDVITNTSGTALGVCFYLSSFGRKFLESRTSFADQPRSEPS